MKTVVKTDTVFKNGLAVSHPEFVECKLQADLRLREALERAFSEVEGQGGACQAVKEALFGTLHRQNSRGPQAVFFFAGPPGVGKTFLAEKIASALGRPFERFDLSSYSDKESPFALFGLNKSYRDAAPGRLTRFLRSNPVSVLLLDEIEKSHPYVRNNLLQLLDTGEVRDLYYEEEISARDAILIFTSNAGNSLYLSGDPYTLSSVSEAEIINALQEQVDPVTHKPCFPQELISRFASGKIVVFNYLRPQTLRDITTKQLYEQRQVLREEYDIAFRLNISTIADLLVLSLGRNADIRTVVRAARGFIFENLEHITEFVRTQSDGGCRISGVHFHTDFSSTTEDVREILFPKEPARILSCGGKKLGYRLTKEIKDCTEPWETSEWPDESEIRKFAPDLAFVEISKKNKGRAQTLFKLLAALRIPICVYTKDKEPLTYYTANGAVSCYGESGADFSDWLCRCIRGVKLSIAAEKFYRSSKVLSYSTHYRYSPKTCTVDVTLSDFRAEIAYSNGERALFASGAAIPEIKFNDIIGAEEAKKELFPMIGQLKNFRSYLANGIRIPRGILLEGPPGSGKTSIAKAVAAEAGLPFLSLNSTQFLSRWVGEGAQKLRETFAAARRYAPAVLFIDEIDAIARDRMGEDASSKHTDDLTNALLSELDGFQDNRQTPVLVIAATNFDTRSPDTKLDKALLRRFDKRVYVGLPDAAGRKFFLERELAKYSFQTVSKSTVESIARRSPGFSLATLELIIQNALRHGEKEGMFTLTDTILEEAFASFTDGERKACDEETLAKTAYHEAGHALVALLLGIKPLYATIAGRANYGGYVCYSEEDKRLFTREECRNRMCIALAGRAADVLSYGDGGISTGASSDLRSATEMAMDMVCRYGMDSSLVYMEAEKGREPKEIQERAAALLNEQYARAERLLTENGAKLKELAEALLEKENLTGEEMERAIGRTS